MAYFPSIYVITSYSIHYTKLYETIAYAITPALVTMGKLYLIDAKGGDPRPFQPAFSLLSVGPISSPPVWSPDGKYILFAGKRDGEPNSQAWRIAPVAGGDPARVTPPALAEHRITSYNVCYTKLLRVKKKLPRTLSCETLEASGYRI